MERFLTHIRHIRLRIMIAVAVGVVVVATTLNASVYAGTYYGKFTGYAMGNQYGAAGVQVTQGDFANHWYIKCPNDPAAWWAYGAVINTPSIAMHYYDGSTIYYSTFYLEDIGDFTCSQGNYWVDIYFGRYRWPGGSCVCGGVSGYCVNGYTNNCTDAVNFGYHYYTYTGP